MRTSAAVLVFLFFTPLAAQPVRFAAIGDYGLAGQAELDVANRVKAWNPDFVITVGDNNYESGAAATIDANIGQYYREFISPYTGSYGAGDSVNRFFPSLGNHDWRTAGAVPYLDYFTLPGNERYYDYVRGPVHFFVVDSDTSEPDGRTSGSLQAQWLAAGLAAAGEPWKLVYFHHPPYCSGTRHGSQYVMRWPFAAWGATAVLAGHEHLYERLHEEGIVYFVNGLGGRSLYPVGTPIAGSASLYNGNYGAMLVTASAESIVFEFRTRTDSLVDRYTIVHAAAAAGVAAAPADFALAQNYPNPFNPSTTFTFSLPERAHVRLEIADALGRAVETLLEGPAGPGEVRRMWSPQNLPTGVYWALLRSGNRTLTRKLVLVR